FGADGGITANVANLTFYAWGAQYEALPFASSLIATTSSTATRVADSITMPVPTIAAGALYVKASTAYVAQTQRLIQIDDGTEANRATLNLKSSSTGEFSFVDSGASEADLATGATAPNTPEQIAAAFQSNDFAVVVNNGTPATASVGGVPSFNTLRLGADSAEGTNLYGHIAQFGVWNSRLSNSELGAEPDSYVTEIFSPVASIGCGSFSILGQDASFYILDDGRTELGCGAFNIVGSAVTTTTTQVTWGVISGPTNSWGGVP
ncbi:MAG: LamG-like jellyroll fold domain-containing protein, partial [Xanthobacteraceae bacterium]